MVTLVSRLIQGVVEVVVLCEVCTVYFVWLADLGKGGMFMTDVCVIYRQLRLEVGHTSFMLNPTEEVSLMRYAELFIML